MAQLNPNFEIDFSDINSYEQIQLLNDTQLAKENLLMHRAYKEPADDAIIRNQFSSFTFVDFCPKLFSTKAPTSGNSGNNSGPINQQQATNGTNFDINKQQSGPSSASRSIRHFELETFSDLFDRINKWLKLNKDWRVVSMETLVFDCTSQFNHQKSSIHQNYLPENTRGLRLFLSPSKSRFSGPQKIGCINVVPRKVSGSHLRAPQQATKPVRYESLDQILARLNELLLTRPIEGRILSVETITLPIVNGYVNTETNYYMDKRLNSLHQSTYMPVNGVGPSPNGATLPDGQPTSKAANVQLARDAPVLIDILRVYYEFGPMVCGLVNLIDFVPRFYSAPTSHQVAVAEKAELNDAQHRHQHQHQHDERQAHEPTTLAADDQPATGRAIVCGDRKIAATESLTRLIRRSLTWFEAERKRILGDSTAMGAEAAPTNSSSGGGTTNEAINLKACNVQVHHKIMLKSELIQVNAANALDRVDTRAMAHARLEAGPISCPQCATCTSSTPVHEWCLELIDLSQAYELKFVRLAYVVPVNSRYTGQQVAGRSLMGPLRSQLRGETSARGQPVDQRETNQSSGTSSSSSGTTTSTPTSRSASAASSSASSAASSPKAAGSQRRQSSAHSSQSDQQEEQSDGNDEGEGDADDDLRIVEELLAQEEAEECNKRAALAMINETNANHAASERAHQLAQDDDGLNDAPIGQLTYRLFAPCQLVNSSSCFAINPVNSSNPLARRGSVDLNGAGLSSENAHPSSLLLGPNHTNSDQHHSSHDHQQQVISFGALFSSRAYDISDGNSANSRQAATTTTTTSAAAAAAAASGQSNLINNSTNSSGKFTTNEFESVEAIRRRMEVYVTTNSMKVIAGETLIVNLSDVLSCLSTAIEQTVVKASFIHRAAPSTWVSVYVLYAAVDEPASQLLEHQRARQERLAQISEQDEESGQGGGQGATDKDLPGASGADQQMEPMFEDDFKLDPANQNKQAADVEAPKQQASGDANERVEVKQDEAGQQQQQQQTIRIEQNPVDSSLTLYNSAYDRTVPLPSQPDDHLGHFVEPNEFFGSHSDYLWLDGDDLLDGQQQLHLEQGALLMAARSSRKGRKLASSSSSSSASKLKSSKRTGRHVDSGCSIM